MNTRSLKTVIIGASENPSRYANKAANSLLQHGHAVELIGSREGKIQGRPIQVGWPELEGVDTVTLYIGPRHQNGLLEYLQKLKPRRVIFNPGTENQELEQQIEAAGIEPIEACTLVMLAVSTY